jgi:hypothetical protein
VSARAEHVRPTHFVYLAPVNSPARKKELCPYEEFVQFVRNI